MLFFLLCVLILFLFVLVFIVDFLEVFYFDRFKRECMKKKIFLILNDMEIEYKYYIVVFNMLILVFFKLVWVYVI